MKHLIAAAALVLALAGCKSAPPLNVNVRFESPLPATVLGQKLVTRVEYSFSDGQQGVSATISPEGRPTDGR